MNKKKFNIIGVVVIVLIIGALSLFGFKEVTKKTSVAFKEKSYHYRYDVDEYIGYWDYYTSWEVPADNENVRIDTDDPGLLIFNALNNDLEDNEITFKYKLEYEGGTSECEFYPGGDPYDSSVLFEFPMNSSSFPFELKETINNLTKTVDLDNNRILFSKEIDGNDVVIMYMSFNDLPNIDAPDFDDYPDTSMTWRYNSGSKKVQIFTTGTWDVADDFSFEHKITYHFIPSFIVGGAPSSQGFAPQIGLINDCSEAFLTDDIDVTLRTQINQVLELANVVVANPIVYQSWQEDEWGTPPTGINNSVFVLYSFDASIKAAKAFNSAMTSKTFIPNFPDGTIVAFSDGNTFTVGGQGAFENSALSVLPNNDYNNSTYVTIRNSLPTETDFTRSFVVKYNKPSNGKIEPYGTVTVQLLGVDDIEPYQTTLIFEDTGEKYPEGYASDVESEVVNDQIGVGAISKLLNGRQLDIEYKVESASSPINALEGGGLVKAFNHWNSTDGGTSDYNMEFGLDYLGIDSEFRLGGDLVVLNGGDYSITSFYPLGDNEYNYKKVGDNFVLEENDIANYSEKNVYVRINGGDKDVIGTIKKNSDGTISYTAKDARTTSVADVNSTNQVILPSNTTHVGIDYTGRLAAIYMGLNMNITINSTDHVKNAIRAIENANKDVLLEFNSPLFVNGSQQGDSYDVSNIALYLSNLDSDTSITYVSSNTKGTNKNTIHYQARVDEKVYFSSDMEEVAKLYLKQQGNSKFYLLATPGGTLTGDVVVKDVNDYVISTTITENKSVNGTNRNLYTVNIENQAENMLVETDVVSSSYTIDYDIEYSDSANSSFGNTVLGDIAYYSADKLSSGYNHILSDSDYENLLNPSARHGFSSLPQGDKHYIYSKNSINVDPVASDVGRPSIEVKVPGGDFTDEAVVKQGSNYQYKLQYTYNDPLLDMTNLVFYDFLENLQVEGTPFNGVLKSVDTSELEALGIRPKVYYSDVLREEFDLSKMEVWTQDRPSDMSTVKAVAIDCGDYQFLGSRIETPTVYLNMTAPLNNNLIGAKSSNRTAVRYKTFGVFDESVSDHTLLTLEKSSMELSVNTKESITGEEVGNGSLDSPTYIRKNLGYLLQVTNPDSTDYSNVSLQMKIDGLVNVDETKLQYYYGDDVSTRTDFDSHVTYENNDNTVSILVDNIPATGKINIFVPVKVRASELSVDNPNINTTSSIVRLNGTAFQSDEIKTYHKVSIPNVSATHSTKSIYSNNIFVGDYTRVQKGETISNMVKITNEGGIIAEDITVVETITNGTVDTSSITNNGVYNNGVITWHIDEIEAGGILELTYDLAIPTAVENNTFFNTTTKVTVVNPYDNTVNILDTTLDKYDVVYRKTSDIKIINTVAGPLANPEKKVKYTFELEGPEYAAGEYEASIFVPEAGASSTPFTIDDTGRASFELDVKLNEQIDIRNLPQGMTYNITRTMLPGYTVAISGYGISDSQQVDEVVFNGTLEGEEGEVRTFNVLDTYSARTSVNLSAKTNYDKDIEADMFEVTFSDGNSVTSATNDAEGNVTFGPFEFVDEVGTYEYTLKLVNGTNDRIVYDSNEFRVVVKITDKGDGTLNQDVTYYNRLGEKVDSITFESTFIPVGLLVQNIHTGDYVNPDKKFKYKINVTSAAPNTTYNVVDKKGNRLEDFTIGSNGKGSYEIELHNEEFIVIEELPVDSTYEIIEYKEDYYESSIKDLDYENNKETLVQSGTIGIGTTRVIFLNNYSTKASFAPQTKVVLNDKELENNEFTFVIKALDSDYKEEVSNDLDGNIYFKSIDYTRPGTYNYEIEMTNKTEPNIKYDTNKLLLTLVLKDNEDGTMSVTPTYRFLNGGTSFVNIYSEEPVINEETTKNSEDARVNPNTNDFLITIFVLLFVAIVSVILGKTYIKKYNNS